MLFFSSGQLSFSLRTAMHVKIFRENQKQKNRLCIPKHVCVSPTITRSLDLLVQYIPSTLMSPCFIPYSVTDVLRHLVSTWTFVSYTTPSCSTEFYIRTSTFLTNRLQVIRTLRGDNCHYSTDHVSCRNVISLFLLFNSKYFLAFVCLFFFATDVRAQTHELLLRSNSFNVIVATQESTGGLFSLYRTIQPQCSPTKLGIWFKKKKNVKYPAGIFGCKEDGEQNPTDIQSRKKDVGFFHALSHEQLRTWPLTFSVFDIALD